jgi:hypothetical protein
MDEAVTPSDTTTPTVEKTDPVKALQAIRDLFAILEPKDLVTVEAASGRTYTLRTVLPARRQIKALRLLEEAMEAAWETKAPQSVPGEGGRFLALVKAALANESILEKAAEAFGVAFQEVVEKEALASEMKVSPTVAADLFPVEAMVEALLPLLARLVTKALETMEAVKTKGPSGKIGITPES